MENQRKKKKKKPAIGRKKKIRSSQISGQSVEDIEVIIPADKYTRYNKSQKGKSRIHKYRSTEKGQKAQLKSVHKYSATEKGKKAKSKAVHEYSATEKGKKNTIKSST